jgi:hypothetical protein
MRLKNFAGTTAVRKKTRAGIARYLKLQIAHLWAQEPPGWVEALKLMKTGDTWELVVPAALGYGADGAGDTIPADQTLVFTMTLAKVEYAP